MANARDSAAKGVVAAVSNFMGTGKRLVAGWNKRRASRGYRAMRPGAAVVVILPLGAALITLGCRMGEANSYVRYSAVNQPPRAMKRLPPNAVEVFLGKPPGRPHVEVGLFEVTSGQDDLGNNRSTEEMMQSLRVHAGLRGCDAVQLLGVEFAGRLQRRVIRAVCDLYVDDEARQAALARGPAPPLPGEGAVCTIDAYPVPQPCSEPLICADQRCVSPYQTAR